MKALKWTIMNGIFALCGYYGIVEGVAGAGYVFWFMFWFCAVGTLLCATSKDAIKKVRQYGRSIPSSICISFDLCILFLVVWNHHYVAGAFYVAHMAALVHIYDGGIVDDPDISSN